LKRAEKLSPGTVAAPVVMAAPKPVAAPVVAMTSAERNELKKIEKEMTTLELRKKEILARFNAPDLGADEAGKLSTELGKVQGDLDSKEMRWLELSEKGG